MHWISGKIYFLEENVYLIKNSFMGIEVLYSGPKNQEEFFIHVQYQEKDRTFYAFTSYEEKSFFQDLLKITGIGPKTAFQIMKNKKIHEIEKALLEGDKEYFKGVSNKILGYLFLEFQKKKRKKISPKEEEILILTTQLGFKKDLVLQVLKKHDLEGSTEVLLQSILKDLDHVLN